MRCDFDRSRKQLCRAAVEVLHWRRLLRVFDFQTLLQGDIRGATVLDVFRDVVDTDAEEKGAGSKASDDHRQEGGDVRIWVGEGELRIS